MDFILGIGLALFLFTIVFILPVSNIHRSRLMVVSTIGISFAFAAAVLFDFIYTILDTIVF